MHTWHYAEGGRRGVSCSISRAINYPVYSQRVNYVALRAPGVSWFTSTCMRVRMCIRAGGRSLFSWAESLTRPRRVPWVSAHDGIKSLHALHESWRTWVSPSWHLRRRVDTPRSITARLYSTRASIYCLFPNFEHACGGVIEEFIN